MMITDLSKRVIPFRKHDAKSVGDGSFYIDTITWLNGARIEIGENVGFNSGCWVNGYGGLTIGDGAIIGPGVTIGDGASIGAGAVVVKDLDDYSVSVGNPAKTSKSRR